MKKIYILPVISIFSLFQAVLAQSGIPSRTYSVFNTPSVQNTASPTAQWTLLGKIQEAQAMLQKTPKLKFSEKQIRVKQKNGKYIMRAGDLEKSEISLALLNVNTGELVERRYWISEEEIKTANTLRKLYIFNSANIPTFTPSDGKHDFAVTVNWWNYFNSDLSVKHSNSKDAYIVIANKYLFKSEDLAYPEERSKTKYSDIIYTPYSSAIHTPELIEAGRKFLDSHVEVAFGQLQNLNIKSRAHPGKLVIETMTPIFIKNIFTTEQTDPKLVFMAEDRGKSLAERVLVRLGANGEKSYRYTYSKTGALGLGQIMPGTYNSMVKNYPSAGLIKNTDIGRVDIINSIKASILVLDDHYASVVTRARNANQTDLLNAKTPSEVEEIRAAIYNGGPGKYQAATGTISDKVRETVEFVKKFRLIRGLSLYN